MNISTMFFDPLRRETMASKSAKTYQFKPNLFFSFIFDRLKISRG